MPSSERVQKVLEQIRKRLANHDYFFTKLSSPDWIDPLEKEGLFSVPPSAHREGNSISFPFWPESQYLTRVAGVAPEKVLSVIEKIPETDNVRIHEDFAKAAIAMPADLAVRWARREISWIDRQDYLYFLLPEALGELFEHLARSGETEGALELARSLLRVSPAKEDDREPHVLFDPWDYEQILKKHYPAVLSAGGVPALRLLCHLLEQAHKKGTERSEAKEDFSWIWRPAIEPNAQNHGHGAIRDVLVDAVRDAASTLAKAGTADCRSVLEELSGFNPVVFQRLQLHVLCEHRELVPDKAEKAAISRVNFDDIRLHHEYARLLRVVFPHISQEKQNVILGWIEAGPDTEKFDENPEIRKKQRFHWQLRRLAILRDCLPPEWRKRYDNMVEEIGEEPDHPDFISYTSSWTGPTSPKTAQELEQMSPKEIALFLRSWEPSDAWHSPEPEGLGRILQAVVTESPSKFADGLFELRGLDPTYSRAIVQGLTEATKKDSQFDWKPVLDYLSWIISTPRSIEGRRGGDFDRDPHWGWARKAAAALLSAGFEKNTIPREFRTLSWEVLLPLIADPDPTPEDDARSSMDPATHSINSTRGEAMHAVVRYALWVHRGQEDEQDKGKKHGGTLDVMPEVRDVLEEHLHPEKDPSPAIRSVYGQWFPWLVLLDREWVNTHIKKIFPREITNLRDAAWNTYITFCPVYNGPFELLQSEYSFEVDRLSAGEEEKSWLGDPWERLGEHLMVLIGRGLIRFEDELGLCRRFFQNANDKTAAHAVAFVGRSLRKGEQDVPDQVIERFRALWDALRASSEDFGAKHPETMKAFGWWFSSGRFELEWSFRNLLQVIRLSQGIEPDFFVIEHLAEVAGSDPANALQVLRSLVMVDKRGWSVLGWRDHARVVIEQALDNPATAEDARTLVHELGARGYLQFRDLLVNPTGGRDGQGGVQGGRR